MDVMSKLVCGNFYVHKSGDKYNIYRYDANACANYPAMLDDDAVFLWSYAPVFNSKFKAYAWLKKNVNNLI